MALPLLSFLASGPIGCTTLYSAGNGPDFTSTATLLLLLLELADELGLDEGNALEPELELTLADVPEDDPAKALEEELAGAPTMDVDVAEVVCDPVRVEGTGIAAVSLATGEPKEPVMESSVNMVEN